MTHFQPIPSLSAAPDRRPSAVIIGNFDGVHLGHQALLRQMVREAHTAGLRPVVLTFFPHPVEVIRGLTGRYYVATLQERVALLAEQGIEMVVTSRFDEAMRTKTATEFVDDLCRYLDMKRLYGGNFSLGYQRQGDFTFLSALGKERNFSVHKLESLVELEGERVSSSRVRRSLAAGEIEDVNGCLGRAWSITGVVEKGQQRGRTIGFPTANLGVWSRQLLPAKGVYATRFSVDGQTHLAATNIGTRPTVDGVGLTVESHLLNFSGDLYDKNATLTFLKFIRPEQKFSGLDALKTQIAADVAAIKLVNG